MSADVHVFHDNNLSTGINPRMAIQLRQQYGLKQLVETGTCYGPTAEFGALLFGEVFTCELCPDLFPGTGDRLDKYPTVHRFYGDSVQWLLDLDMKHQPPSLVWLDAHWTAVGPRPEGGDTPILQELEAIGGCHGKHVILIDDIRIFGNPQWPTIADLETAADHMNGYFQYIGDVMVITPDPFAFSESTRLIEFSSGAFPDGSFQSVASAFYRPGSPTSTAAATRFPILPPRFRSSMASYC